MTRAAWMLGLLSLLWPTPAASAGERPWERINRRLCGRVVDHTNHHGADRRMWAASLGRPNNLYVYLPPGFDPGRPYPLVIWLHGYAEDERSAPKHVFPEFDKEIVCGRMPPTIVAAPSGRIPGWLFGSLFLNTHVGCYEDLVVCDVWHFLQKHYPIHPDRRRRAIVGLSSGGWAAYVIGLKHPDKFGIIAGILPTLNPRFVDCHGVYFRRDFDPCCWGLRPTLDRNQLLGIYYGLPITLKRMVRPFFGWGPEGLARLSANNPIELLDRCGVQPGMFALHVSYIHDDQLNADAQIESFLYVARHRGINVDVHYRPRGGAHTVGTGLQLLPATLHWLGPRLRDGVVECPALAFP
ncbi:MAG: alpha/beta hydrolase-fold protein [Gemmataceae bacterium]|nr:alpha/beta hydrolase-fold protein [Gemmataceae bacterium]MDW8265568.1 alpha/beta hydrolase-fold protein [Gemmataceae bacterium]